jgi:hypothetical protein
MPNRGQWARKKADVAENTWRWATTWSPDEQRPSTTALTAAMPEAKASAASAPSSWATASSKSLTVGLPKRE